MRRIIIFLIVAFLVFLAWEFFAIRPLDHEDQKSKAFTVSQGDSLSTIASNLSEAELIRSALAFRIYARFSGASRYLQAGVFGVSPSYSVSTIISIIKDGKSEEFLVTIPEGFTVAQIDKLLAKKGLGKEGDIIDCAFRCDFSSFDFLPETAGGSREEGFGSRLEGYLFPETYAVSPADYVPKFFIERMLGTFRKRIVTGLSEDIKASGRPLTDIVVMASIIEMESRREEERAVVSGILWKRLENKVVLGVDAVTRYVLSKPTQALTKTDLEAESAYNTRRTLGLPPSPIANAGESAFSAALHPKESPYWYYLHGNDGVIRYAITNDDHNVNKARYLR